MGKLPNPNRAKIHRSYTVEEVAELFSVHKNTVREWIKTGLPIGDDKRPLLILGIDLRDFLQQKRTARKQKCKPFELFCLRCRSPQHPAENMAEYEPINATTGRLIAICPACTGLMNKFISRANVAKIEGQLDITIPKTLKDINKRV